MQLAHNLASSPLQGEEAFIYIGDEINSVLDPHKNLPTWTSSPVSPSVARAHAMEEFSTLSVPHVLIVDKPMFLGPEDLKQLQKPLISPVGKVPCGSIRLEVYNDYSIHPCR